MTSNVRPTCQPAEVPLSIKILTNKTALTYTLTEVRNATSDSNQVFLSTLVYYNNLLQDSTVDSIKIDVGQYDRTAAQMAMEPYGVDAMANVVCQVDSASTGNVVVDLSATYNLLPQSASTWGEQSNFLGSNGRTSASLYWDEAMPSMFWTQISFQMMTCVQESLYYSMYSDLLIYTNGINELTMYFTRNETTDMLDTAFFEVDWRLVLGLMNRPWGLLYQFSAGSVDPLLKTILTLSQTQEPPNTWIAGEKFEKAFYTTIVVDLGQVDASPNILTNDSQLTNFTSQFPTIQTDASHIGALAIGPAQHPYSPLTDTQGPLGIQSSVLASKYLYQVPQRKAWGTLITFMLVADLVFLQALWLTITLAVGMWMKHKYHDRDFCEDCRKRKESRSSTAESEPEYTKVAEVHEMSCLFRMMETWCGCCACGPFRSLGARNPIGPSESRRRWYWPSPARWATMNGAWLMNVND